MTDIVSTKRTHFDRLVADWADADRECRRLHVLWATAIERRVRLSIAKNDALEELEMAKAEAAKAVAS